MNAQCIISAIHLQLLSFGMQFHTLADDFAIRLFGTSILFVLKILGGIFILFLLSAAVSHILKLDKFYENSFHR